MRYERRTDRWRHHHGVPVVAVDFLHQSAAGDHRHCPVSSNLHPRWSGKSCRFDPWGAGSLAVGLASLIASLSFSSDLGFGSPFIISAFILGIVSLAAFVIIERRVADPVVKFSLLRDRVFLSANLSLVLGFLALFAVGFVMPRALPWQLSGGKQKMDR